MRILIIKKEIKIIISKLKNISSARSKSEINYYNNERKNESEEMKYDEKNEKNSNRMNNKYNNKYIRLIMKQKENEEYVKKQLLNISIN